MIAKTLAETTSEEAEWIMWVDIDTIIADMTIVPRFDEYEGADLIVWGQRDKLMQGNLNEGDSTLDQAEPDMHMPARRGKLLIYLTSHR